MSNVEVIVTSCMWDAQNNSWHNVMYPIQRSVSEYPTLKEALSKGEACRVKGMSVFIRPTYNEKDEEGSFFREWRSFDGGVFKEVIFRQR